MKIKHLLLLILIGGLLYLDYLWYIIADFSIVLWILTNIALTTVSLIVGIALFKDYIKNNEFPKIKRFLNFKLF